MSTRKPIEIGDFVKIDEKKLFNYTQIFPRQFEPKQGYEIVAISSRRPKQYFLKPARRPDPIAVWGKDCKLHHRKEKEKEATP